MFSFLGFVGAAVILELMGEEATNYGYGEATLGRVPDHLWRGGGFGIRGTPMNWRGHDQNYESGYGAGYNVNVSRPGIGMRGPTSSYRYPLPRPWERLPPLEAETVSARPHVRFGEDEYGEDEYGVMTGSGGIRGMPSSGGFTAAQIAAYNREGAAQGLRGGSVAPPG